MPPSKYSALAALVGTCALWGLSFPLMKALGLEVSARAPGVSTWFVAAATVVVRFGSGALLLSARGLPRATSRELKQGLLLGACSGLGMLLQMDALNFSPASTSAFLTQGYIVILPTVTAFRARALPPVKTVTCVLISAAGLYILSGFDWVAVSLGRGETETLFAACSFAGQILTLDDPAYAGNRPRVVTVIMFACQSVLLLPLTFFTARSPSDFGLLFATPTALCLVLLLSVPCTLVAFSLMNRYQPFLSASEAGIIYGAEPLFASVFALFLPAMLARLGGIAYDDERLTARLVLGGGLVVAANLILQLRLSNFTARRALRERAGR